MEELGVGRGNSAGRPRLPPWSERELCEFRGRIGELLAFDIRLEVGDNNERQGCQPSGHRGDLAGVLRLAVAAPMSGVVFMQRANTLLIVETKAMHHWPSALGRVASTSSPDGATPESGMPEALALRCDPLKVQPTGISSGSDVDSLLD
jgi:hypothetical protein